ncbi:hypothetical protein LOK49_LG07G01732 [Camellia lanceoleosa]|uniref:Uncharacterized protein n=1 Tax=Camellia lanceoleosa TaxID=1840588 RepID=A0ACC0H0B1_9ERIC|nr:hypothetical protein LOK49_LG07G01732 [Camellia lanceoleosa]
MYLSSWGMDDCCVLLKGGGSCMGGGNMCEEVAGFACVVCCCLLCYAVGWRGGVCFCLVLLPGAACVVYGCRGLFVWEVVIVFMVYCPAMFYSLLCSVVGWRGGVCFCRVSMVIVFMGGGTWV